MALKGSLREMSLSDIIQITCRGRSQACLLVESRDEQASLFFQDGQIVHATLDSEEGEEVVYEVLTWEEGAFELEQGVAPPKLTIAANWSGLLLEGMRRIDESAAELDGLEGGEVELQMDGLPLEGTVADDRSGLLLEGMPRVDEGTAEVEVEWDEVEAEETERMGDGTAERIARGLKRISGVEGALICSQEGEVLGQDTSDDPVREAALTAFVGHRAEALAVLLNAGQLRQVALAGEKWRAMIVTHEQNYVGLSLAQRTSAEAMAPTIQMTLRRYR